MQRLKAQADQLVAAEIKPETKGGWPFVTDAHFRFVANTSVSFIYYLYGAPPADAARLKAAIVRAADSIEMPVMSRWADVDYLPTIVTALAYQQTGDRRYAAMMSALLQRLSMPHDLKVAPDELTALRALEFEGMVEVARKWGVNNLYTASMHDLAPLPYAIAALQKAGMDESAVCGRVARTNPMVEPFEEVIPATGDQARDRFSLHRHVQAPVSERYRRRPFRTGPPGEWQAVGACTQRACADTGGGQGAVQPLGKCKHLVRSVGQ